MAISIKIGANASDAIRAAKQTGDAIESIGDSLDDLARDSQRQSRDAGDDLAKGIDQGTEKAERSVKDLEKTFKDSVRDMQRTDGKGGLGKNISDDMRKGTAEAGESVGTFKDEAKANLSEVASSFSGDMTSVVDLVQGTLGGVVADLGPIGLAAGALAAVGVGLIGAAITGTQEDAEVFRQRVSDLANEFIETGRTGSASMGYIVDQLKEMATTTEDGATSLKDLRQAADRGGSSYRDLARATAGHTDEIDKQIDAIVKQKNEWQKTGQAQLEADDVFGSSANNRTKALDETLGYLRDAKKASKEAAQEQKNFAEAGGPALQAAADATQAYADGVQSAYSEAGSAIDDFVKDGKFNLQAYNESMEASAKAISSYQDNVVTASADLSAQALQYIQSLGPEAAPALQAFVDAPLAQRERTARNWDQLGATSASSYNSKLQSDLDARPATKQIDLRVNRKELDAVYAEAGKAINQTVNILQNITTKRNGKGVP